MKTLPSSTNGLNIDGPVAAHIPGMNSDLRRQSKPFWKKVWESEQLLILELQEPEFIQTLTVTQKFRPATI